MIYEAARHEALNGSSWNEATSREYIQRIAADANATFSRRDLWSTHPLEEARPGTRFYNLYFGAGGVVWALNHLRRIGAIVDHPDFQEVMPELRAANRAQIEEGGRWRSHGADGLLIGDAGLLLVAGRLAGLSTVADQLGAAVDNTKDNPVREFMFGSPGTATLSLALFEETGDDIWASRFRRDIRFLWDRLEACEGADCLIWEQNLQGHKATHLGAVHGFLSCVARPTSLARERAKTMARLHCSHAAGDGSARGGVDQLAAIGWQTSTGPHRNADAALSWCTWHCEHHGYFSGLSH
jgi:hypothetical protein